MELFTLCVPAKALNSPSIASCVGRMDSRWLLASWGLLKWTFVGLPPPAASYAGSPLPRVVAFRKVGKS